MNEKTLGIVIVTLVLAAGIIGIVNISKDATGAAATGRKQCCCEIDHYDFYGSQVGKEIHGPIRANNIDNCEVYCDRHLGNSKRRDIALAYPC